MYGHEVIGWGYPLTLIGMLAFWAVLIFGVVALVRYVSRGRHQDGLAGRADRSPGAEGLLAERFARGEISEDEYRRHLATLRAG